MRELSPLRTRKRQSVSEPESSGGAGGVPLHSHLLKRLRREDDKFMAPLGAFGYLQE